MKTVTVKEFSQKTGKRPDIIRKWCRDGHYLTCLKLKGRWLIPKKELDLWSGTFAALRKGEMKNPESDLQALAKSKSEGQDV